MIVLKHCRLIPELTEGFRETYADLVIEGKYIKDIIPSDSINFESGTVIDLKGCTLLPGLFDLHAHLMFMNQDYYASMMRPQNQYLIDCMDHAQMYLRHGYTTIRDCGNNYYAGVATRDAVNRGIIQGARIITAGKIISPTAKGNESFGTLYWETDNPEDMYQICRTEVAKGVDFIKYMVTGAVLNEGGVPGELVTTSKEISAITTAAASLGTYVAAHCHGTEGIKLAVKNGVKTIEHASYIDEECVELMLQRKDFVSIVPTFAIAYTLYKELYEGGVLPEFVVKSRDACTHMAQGLKMCIDAGISAGWGTDLDMEMFERYPGLEFIARTELGFSNIECLKEATINSARIVDLDDVCGTIKVGKYADLIAVAGNPDEDITVMKTLPKYVFKEGTLSSHCNGGINE